MRVNGVKTTKEMVMVSKYGPMESDMKDSSAEMLYTVKDP